MNKSIASLLCLVAISAASFSPAVAVGAGEPATGTTAATTTVDPVTGTTDTSGLTLSQEQIDALQAQDPANRNSDDRSVFEKASDFVSDHAPFFIIGIVVVAAILAGIFISRGRRTNDPASTKGKAPALPVAGSGPPVAAASRAPSATSPASVPSTQELRRRKRAAAQQAREDERMRRKAGYDGRRRTASPPLETDVGPLVSASTASLALDPIEAEKRAAKGLPPIAPAPAAAASVQAPRPARATAPPAAPAAPAPSAAPVAPAAAAAAGVAASRASSLAASATSAIPAPVSPSQTAPAVGVVTPEQALTASDDTIYSRPAKALDEAAGSAPDPEPATQVHEVHEPAIEAPGPDAATGEAAAAFAAGAAGGGIAARSLSENDQPAPAVPGALPEPVAAEVPPATGPGEADAEQRLRAKVDEIKAAQPHRVVEANPAGDALAGEANEGLVRKRLEAEAVQAEIDRIQTPATPPAGLEGVESRLEENRQRRDEALQIAEDRLRRIEERAELAESRVALAERMTQLNLEEAEREERLNSVLTGIDRAEERTREAENRAEAAEKAAAAALQGLASATPATPAKSAPAFPMPRVAPPAPAPPGPTPVESAASEPAPRAEPSSAPTPEPAKPSSPFGRVFSPDSKSTGLNINTATFEELRAADLSVTQATRILAYRERFGGYSSIDDLEKVPGFPAEMIESLRSKISV